MAGGVGTASGEADSLRFEPAPALVDPSAVPARRDPATGEKVAVGVFQPSPCGGAADDPGAPTTERNAGDLPVGRPLAPPDKRRHSRDPVGYSGRTHTLPAVSRLRITSRSAAWRRIVLPTRSISNSAKRVPGTRFRSWR